MVEDGRISLRLKENISIESPVKIKNDMILKTRTIIPNSMTCKVESTWKSRLKTMVNMKTPRRNQSSWNLTIMRSFSSKFKTDLILRKMWRLQNNSKMCFITERNLSQTPLFEKRCLCLQLLLFSNRNSSNQIGHLTLELQIAFMFQRNKASSSFQESQLCLAKHVCLNLITRKFQT